MKLCRQVKRHFEQADNHSASDDQLNEKVLKLVTAFDEYMNDDINTAKVIANMFELVPIINSLKDKHISATALDSKTIVFMKKQLTAFIVDIFGLESSKANNNNNKLEGVLQLLINMRKEAKQRKDFVTSDKIRNELTALGIQLKDEKDGGMSYTIQ